MKARLGFALVVAGLTAFAPAPFPKTERRVQEPEISLKSFQGTWRIVAMHESRANGQHAPIKITVSHVRIKGDRWTFLPDTYGGANLDVSIDHKKSPAQLNFYSVSDPKKKVYGVGLLRRQGPNVQLLYTWGGENARPAAFEPSPDYYWILTLERDKNPGLGR
jgi:uncharacterized protein (TIGR03067 family)